MRDRHFAVAFTKQVNGINIVHTQFVFANLENQMEMLKRFVRSKDEMLANAVTAIGAPSRSLS